MKGRAIVAAVLVAAATLGACGGDDETESTEQAAQDAAQEQRTVLLAAQQARQNAIEQAGGDSAVEGAYPSDLLGPYVGTRSEPETESADQGFATFTDETGALSVEAPADWQSWSRRSPTLDNGPGIIVADGDPQVFHSQEFELTIDGVNFIASAKLAQRLGITDSSPASVLALTNWLSEEIGFFDGACGSYGGASIYERGDYHGLSRIWEDCGGHGKVIKDVAALPADGSYVLYIQLTYSPADQDVADRVFDTFSVDGQALSGA